MTVKRPTNKWMVFVASATVLVRDASDSGEVE
jgi:hypothetical protein